MPDEIAQVSGVENVVAAVPQENEAPPAAVENEPAESGDKVEAAFAKRFAAERAKLESEYAERYKDFDRYKGISEYFREMNEMSDVSELSDRIEMERLQERAQQAQVSPEVQRRLEELEAKAAEADQLREQQNVQSWYKDFRADLDKFAADKQASADEIEQYMIENQISNYEIAYKALRFADAEKQREEIEKAAIARYIESKKAPNVVGAGGIAAPVPAASPKTWDQARAGALEMMRNAKNNL